MPKFYRQNKKKIDPRYFLNETTNRGEDVEEAISSRFDGEMDAMRRIKPGKDMMSDKSYASGYNSQADTDIEKIKDALETKLQYNFLGGPENQAKQGAVLDALLSGEVAEEDIIALDKAGDEGERALKTAISNVFQKLKDGDLAAHPPGIDSDDDGIDDKKEDALRNILDSD
tara:strand:+ start:719 stop:1234 length:516 start_codon:yes stop_codon:yes gene_type:complete